jgi:hypothetical protein
MEIENPSLTPPKREKGEKSQRRLKIWQQTFNSTAFVLKKNYE